MSTLRDDNLTKNNQKTTVEMASSSFAQMFDEILRRELTAVLSRVAEGEGLELENLVSKYLPADVVPAKTIKAAPKKKRVAKVSVNPEPTEAVATKSTKCTSTASACAGSTSSRLKSRRLLPVSLVHHPVRRSSQ
jgi:hypothetical protein